MRVTKYNTAEKCQRLTALLNKLQYKNGFSPMTLFSAGFNFTGDDNLVRCDTCGLEVSEWTPDMRPIDIHSQRSPNCEFIRNLSLNLFTTIDQQENPSKRQKLDSSYIRIKPKMEPEETEIIKQIRHRTYSHWGSEKQKFTFHLIIAGFFATSVNDRVICVYCNLICQEWLVQSDDPIEVHCTLSPKCPYVLSNLFQLKSCLPSIQSTDSENKEILQMTSIEDHFLQSIVDVSPTHSEYTDIIIRKQSFSTRLHETSPSAEVLSRAGFFYTSETKQVTCFCCGYSLEESNTNGNPIVEHLRVSNQCQYAQRLAGDKLCRRIEETKRFLIEFNASSKHSAFNNTVSITNNLESQLNDSTMLTRFVAARLDLESSQKLLNRNFTLPVIKRCWEDQLQLKKDDFISDTYLLFACVILQKQIDTIQGNKDKIIIPSAAMRLHRNGQKSNSSSTSASSNSSNADRSQNKAEIQTKPTTVNQNVSIKQGLDSINEVTVHNPCTICRRNEKRLACIPCGHFVVCLDCSQTIRTCPNCHKQIEAFVRIYV